MNSLGMALQLALCNLSKDSHFCVLHFYKLRVFLGKVRGLATAAWLTGRRMPSRSRSQFIDSWPEKTKYVCAISRHIKKNKPGPSLNMPLHPLKLFYINSPKLWMAGEWRGLVVSTEDCHSKGRAFETAPSPLLFSRTYLEQTLSLA